MGKGERKQAEKMANENSSRAISQGSDIQGKLGTELEGATSEAHNLSGKIQSGYEGMMGGTGSYDPAEHARLSAQNQNNVQTAGYDPNALNKTRGDISKNVETGGFDPEALDRLNSQYSQLTLKGLGGVNEEQAGKVRGAYGNLIDNGGISKDTEGAMQRQTASAAQSIYASLGSNLARQQSASGFGGAGGETAQLARQAGQTAATGVTGVNAEVGKLRQTGTIAGVGGLADFERGVAGGQREAVAGAGRVLSDQAGNRVTSAGQESQLATSEATNRLNASKTDQDLATNVADQKIKAAGGLVNLYNSDPGYVKTLVNGILDSQKTTGQLTSQQAQIMAEISKQPGLLQTIIGDVAQLGGAAAGVLGGVGAVKHG